MKLLQLIAVILLSVTCRKAPDFSVENNVLHLDLTGRISTLDPAKSYDTISANIIYQCYETLYQYHYLKRPYVLEPLLAQKMPQVSEDGKTYTIHIKKNIRYHDDPAFNGKKRFVKAQDFINQIKRLAFKPVDSSGWSNLDGKIVGLNEFREKVGNNFIKFKTTPVKGLRAPDDYTLIIELTRPYPQLISLLAMSFTAPIPLEVINYYQNDLSTHLVGTGPFKLSQYLPKEPNKNVILTKFKFFHHERYPSQGDRLANSWGLLKDAGAKLPFLNKVVYSYNPDGEKKWQKFLNNKLDILPLPIRFYKTAITPLGRLKPQLKNKGIRILISPTLTSWWLSFNMRDPIVGKNIKLRKAIAHAIDIEGYIKKFTHNLGLKANSIYTPGIPGYDPTRELSHYYDLKKAKQLLAEAGYPNGKNLPVLVYSVRGTSEAIKHQAEYIKEQLAKVNIKIKIDLNSFNQFLKKSNQGKLQFWYDGWVMDYPDAENTLQLLSKKSFPPGPNTTFYYNPRVEQLLTEYKQLTDLKRKKEIMREIEDIIDRDQPWIMLYYARSYVLYHSRLKNYRHSDVIYNYVKYLKF